MLCIGLCSRAACCVLQRDPFLLWQPAAHDDIDRIFMDGVKRNTHISYSITLRACPDSRGAHLGYKYTYLPHKALLLYMYIDEVHHIITSLLFFPSIQSIFTGRTASHFASCGLRGDDIGEVRYAHFASRTLLHFSSNYRTGRDGNGK